MPAIALITSVLLPASSLVTLVLVTRHCGRGAEGAANDGTLPEGEALRPFLVFGAFYANPDDPRGWVKKIDGVGITLNLRTRRLAALYLGAICGAAAGGIGFTAAVLLGLSRLG